MTKRLLVERSCSVKVTRCGLSSGAEMTPCTLASLGLEGLGPSSPRQAASTELSVCLASAPAAAPVGEAVAAGADVAATAAEAGEAGGAGDGGEVDAGGGGGGGGGGAR